MEYKLNIILNMITTWSHANKRYRWMFELSFLVIALIL